MDKIWKDIEGAEGSYQVSNLGRVRSLDRYVSSKGGLCFKKGAVKSLFVSNVGYLRVHLHLEDGPVNKSVHRLVASAFLPNPFDLAQVNHLDGVKENNRVDNLVWSSASENVQHAYEVLGRKQKGREEVPVFVSSADLTGFLFPSMSCAARAMRLDVSTLRRVLTGARNFARGYHAEPV